MGIFGALGTSASGLHVYRTWLDAISDNIANVNTARSTADNAFQARYVVATARAGMNGVDVGGVALGSAQGRVQYEPGNPLADAFLWIKTPGQSDGQCHRGTTGPVDPVRGIVDPDAGVWFPQMALELVHDANPPIVR